MNNDYQKDAGRAVRMYLATLRPCSKTTRGPKLSLYERDVEAEIGSRLACY